MSRNVDKANSILVRFQELEAEKNGGYKDYARFKRPTRVVSVSRSDEAQQWRSQVLRDINSRLTRMHDPSLNDLQLRELNDELNELFNEKSRWERHIRRNLKGPDFSRDKTLKFAGTVLNGRRYFGRALELPEVRQLIQEDTERRSKLKTSKQNNKALQDKVRTWKQQLGPYYYGFSSQENVTLQVPLDINTETAKSLLSPIIAKQTSLNEFEQDKSLELRSEVGSQDSITAPKSIIPTFEDLPDLKDMELWLVKRRRTQLQKQLNL